MLVIKTRHVGRARALIWAGVHFVIFVSTKTRLPWRDLANDFVRTAEDTSLRLWLLDNIGAS
ncbi:hypothetical protein Dimus_022617, partial [Dionaea muscipula]